MRLATLAVSTCVLAGSDAAASSSATTTALSPAPTACELALREARIALRSETPLEPLEANRLHRTVLHAIGPADVDCAARFGELLERAPCRGQATGVVASASFAAGAFPPALTAALVDRAVDRAISGDDACVREVLPAVQQAARVDAALRAAVSRAAEATDEALADAGWLVLGTIAKAARDGGDSSLAGEIDAELAAALRAAPAARDVALLEAAGNAGCVACAAAIEAVSSSDADPWRRRAAIGAWRFIPSGEGPMCVALRSDASALVREHASWALGLSSAGRELRMQCLIEALNADANEEVRSAASRSLLQLQREETTR